MTCASASKISAWGYYLPEKVLSNAELETMVDTNDEWIVTRTGIHERHIASREEFASTLGIRAVSDLVERNGVHVDDVDTIIATSFTPDYFSPTVSALIQGHFGMEHARTFDLGAGCTGFTYALDVADALISCGKSSKVLIVSAESISKVVDYEDRSTCILFGDAATACLLEHSDSDRPGCLQASYFSTHGDQAAEVTCGNLADSLNGQPVKRGIFQQNGQHVYKFVMLNIPPGIERLCEAGGVQLDNIDWFIPHSANMRIIEMLGKKLSVPENRILTSVASCGNTSSASIPLAICLALKEGRIASGDTALLYGFGGGLTHGGVVVNL